MITLKRTNSEDQDFQVLANELEEELKKRDGENHQFYAQLNKVGTLKNTIVAYEKNEAVGCGALREYSDSAIEIKRMFVRQLRRGKGVATMILNELEVWSTELGYEKCVLETGQNQPEAVSFYRKNNYRIIPNFGRYKNSENSICFEKVLISSIEK